MRRHCRPALAPGVMRVLALLLFATHAHSQPTKGATKPVDTRGGVGTAAGAAAAAPAPAAATSSVVVGTADALSALTQQAWQFAPTPVLSLTPGAVTRSHWLARTLKQLEKDKQIGVPTSIKFVPGRGDAAAFVMSRGEGRCCNRWCYVEEGDVNYPNATATMDCETPIPEPTVLLLQAPTEPGALGTVTARYLADTLYFPHAMTISPDGSTLFVTDRMLGQALAVDAATGKVIQRYGTSWALDAVKEGAEFDGMAGGTRAFYGAARERYGRSAMAEPTSAMATSDGRMIVASGYYDARLILFDKATGNLLGDVLRGPPLSPDGLISAMADAAPAAPPDADLPAAGVRQAVSFLRRYRDARGVNAGWLDGLAREAALPAKKVSLQALVRPLGDSALANDSQIVIGDTRGDAADNAPPTHVAAKGAAWPWRNPHAIDIDEGRNLLWVTDRERPAVDALDLTTLDHICTYPLAALGDGGEAFAVTYAPPAGGADTRGRLFALLSRRPTTASVVVELDPDECGAIKAQYTVPLGEFPQHDLAVATLPDGRGATLVVAAQPTQVYKLPPRQAGGAFATTSDEDADEAAVQSLLVVMWTSMAVLALLIPAAVLAHRAVRGCVAGGSRLAASRRGPRSRDVEAVTGPSSMVGRTPAESVKAVGPSSAAAAATTAAAAVDQPTSPRSRSAAAAPAQPPSNELTPPRPVVPSPFASAETSPAPKQAASLSKQATPPSTAPRASGTVIFIRHGESTSNERGILAGVRDVDLTRFGRLQAQAAGADIKRAAPGIVFDVVYVSTLRRTARTARIALAAAGQPRGLRLTADTRLSEKSFGIFAGQNIRLLQRALGRATYDHLLHSPNEAPPLGETAESVYDRVVDFYESRVVPDLQAGRNVLVAGHQYALEPLSLYLAGISPADYAPANLPNGKAMTADDMARLVKRAIGGWRLKMQHFGSDCVLAAIVGAALATLVGVMVSVAIGHPLLPSYGAMGIVSVCLAVMTFYAMLECDLRDAFAKCPRAPTATVAGITLARAAIAAAMLAVCAVVTRTAHTRPDSPRLNSQVALVALNAMFYLTPPAASVPTLSLLWGGGLYLAVVAALLLSIVLAPAQAVAIVVGAVPGVHVGRALGPFAIIFVCSVIIPAAAATAYRAVNPVACKHHAKLWSWVAAPALWLLMFVGGASLAPTDLRRAIFTVGNGILPLLMPRTNTALKGPHTMMEISIASATSMHAGVIMLANGLVLRAVALGACWLLQHVPHRAPPPSSAAPSATPGASSRAAASTAPTADADGVVAAMSRRDVFILGTSFNPFLYAAIAVGLPAAASGDAPVGAFMGFWALVLFAIFPVIDQAVLTRSFMRDALVRAHRTDAVVPDDAVRALWNVMVASVRTGHGDNITRANTADYTRLVRHQRAVTTGDAGGDEDDGIDMYTARELRAALLRLRRSSLATGSADDTLTYAQFERFFKATAGQVDLNTRPPSGRMDRTSRPPSRGPRSEFNE